MMSPMIEIVNDVEYNEASESFENSELIMKLLKYSRPKK